ncbi:MAG: hypothetical protein AAGH87_04645 [Pseudomonadota bacterium]
MDRDSAVFETAGGEVFVSAGELHVPPEFDATVSLHTEPITLDSCAPRIIALNSPAYASA